jgi:hypothetical protein
MRFDVRGLRADGSVVSLPVDAADHEAAVQQAKADGLAPRGNRAGRFPLLGFIQEWVSLLQGDRPGLFTARLALTMGYPSADMRDLRRWTPAFELLPVTQALAARMVLLRDVAGVLQWLGRICAAGQAPGLALHSGAYKRERSADAPYLRYRISLPMSGSYGQIRGFLAAVLADLPAASVDDVQLKKDGAGGPLEERIRPSLFIATY